MTHTTNYSLPQWEASDAVKRGDVNGAMSSIDAALGEIAGSGLRIAAGRYYGSGETNRKIPLDFTPKFVLVSREGNLWSDSSEICSGFAVTGGAAQGVEITDGGFIVHWQYGSPMVWCNYNGWWFHYVAIG